MAILTSKNAPLHKGSVPVKEEPAAPDPKVEPAQGGQPTVPAVKGKEEDMRTRFKLKSAPMGVSGCGIQSEDSAVTLQVEMVDQIARLDMTTAEGKRMAPLLLRAGFQIDGTEKDPEPAVEPADALNEKGKLKEPIRLRHPDASEGENMNLDVSFNLGPKYGGVRTVKLTDSVAEVDEPALVRHMMKKGYIVQNLAALETSGIKE